MAHAVNVQELSAKSAHQYREKKTLECMINEQAFVAKQGSIYTINNIKQAINDCYSYEVN